jgi:hypothetical protein
MRFLWCYVITFSFLSGLWNKYVKQWAIIERAFTLVTKAIYRAQDIKQLSQKKN